MQLHVHCVVGGLTMPEYIERETAIDSSNIITVQTREYNSIEVIPVDCIADLPAADVVEVVHGRWEVYLGGKEIMCSACKATFFTEDGETSKYCPNCGARMDL